MPIRTISYSQPAPLVASPPSSAVVGATSGKVLDSNPNRTSLYFNNLSQNVISFGFGSDAVLNSGITLNPGEWLMMTEGTFTRQQINAIASSGGSNLAIQEYV